MAYSDVDALEVTDTNMVDVTARGGTRRERGAIIGAYVRKLSGRFVLVSISYSETYGFQTATYARYRKI